MTIPYLIFHNTPFHCWPISVWFVNFSSCTTKVTQLYDVFGAKQQIFHLSECKTDMLYTITMPHFMNFTSSVQLAMMANNLQTCSVTYFQISVDYWGLLAVHMLHSTTRLIESLYYLITWQSTSSCLQYIYKLASWITQKHNCVLHYSTTEKELFLCYSTTINANVKNTVS